MPSDSYVPTHNNKNILHKHFFLSHLKTTIQISRSWLIFISIPLKQRWDPKKTSYLFSSSTAAIAKSFQSCSTLYDPRECSPPSLGFSRQEHWSGLPFSSPVQESEKQNWSCTVESNTTSNTTNETATKIDLIVKYINITDRQEMESSCVIWAFFGIALSLGLEWKFTFSSPVATAEFSTFAGIVSAALSQHHLSGFEIDQLEFHHLH